MQLKELIKSLLPDKVRTSRYYIYYFLLVVRNFLFAEKRVENIKNIPIIINNFNRYNMLKDLVECFEKRGYKNIFIIDNNSTYPPLLEYYKTTPYHVYRLKENMGFMAFVKSGIYKHFKNRFFVFLANVNFRITA